MGPQAKYAFTFAPKARLWVSGVDVYLQDVSSLSVQEPRVAVLCPPHPRVTGCTFAKEAKNGLKGQSYLL